MHITDLLFGCDLGYMPSDLYNLNSAYGTVEDLKQCINEMHAQDLLVSLHQLKNIKFSLHLCSKAVIWPGKHFMSDKLQFFMSIP